MRLVLLLTVLGLPSQAKAQGPARLTLLDAWNHQRKHILAVIDSATPEMLGFRTTKGVRTFAEQIDHITGVAVTIVGRAVAGTPVPKELAGDTAVYLHDQAKLRSHADQYFGFVIESLSGLTDDQLSVDQAFAGGTMPKWRWNLTALQHSAWTLGQLVPYLRMNNRIPPQFTPF
jgi:hypothetical protein